MTFINTAPTCARCPAPATHACDACGATGCDAHRGCEHEPERLRAVWRAVLWRRGDDATEAAVTAYVEHHPEAAPNRRYLAEHGVAEAESHVGHGPTAAAAVWSALAPRHPSHYAVREVVPPGGLTRAEERAAIRAYLAARDRATAATTAEGVSADDALAAMAAEEDAAEALRRLAGAT